MCGGKNQPDAGQLWWKSDFVAWRREHPLRKLRNQALYCVALLLMLLILTCIAVDVGLTPGDRAAAASNAAKLGKVLNGSDVEWHLSRGVYFVANPVVVDDFSGGLIFSPGASLVFTNNTARGMKFTGGENARFVHVRATFDPMPAKRGSPLEAFAMYRAVRPRWERFVLRGAVGAGLLICDSVRPAVIDAVVSDTKADGVHFCNCEEPEARGIRTNNTGDDGLAFVNYGKQVALQGGTAVDVVVLNSMARGVSVVGQANVQLTNLYIENTTHSGLYVAHEVYYDTRVPNRVRISEAMLRYAGAWNCSAVDPTNGNCFKVSSARDPAVGVHNVGSVTLTGVRVIGASGLAPGQKVLGGYGFTITSAANAPPSRVDLHGCAVEDVPKACLYAYAPEGTTLKTQRLDVFASDFQAERCGGPALTAIGLGRLAVSSLRAVDACTAAPPLRRLVWTERNRVVMLGGLQALYTNAEEGVYCDKICAQCGRFGGTCAVDDVAWLFDGGVVGNLTVQNDGAACRLKI